MHLQKFIGWLSKNFVRQGLEFFQGRRYTYGIEVLKKRRNVVGRAFCDAINC